MVPQQSEGKRYLVCKKCGYKKEVAAKQGYMQREEISLDKRGKLIVLESADKRDKEKIEEERELLKEYYEIFLESMESEGE